MANFPLSFFQKFNFTHYFLPSSTRFFFFSRLLQLKPEEDCAHVVLGCNGGEDRVFCKIKSWTSNKTGKGGGRGEEGRNVREGNEEG